MTYAAFHLYFTIPQTIILWFLCWRLLKREQLKQLFYGASLLALLAVVWTTPWDNYLIYKEVWWYGADKVLGTIGYVPIEEYFFFVIQCYFTAGFLGVLLKFMPWVKDEKKQEKGTSNILLAFSFTLFFYGLYCLQHTELFYMGLILSWSTPIFFIQQFFGRHFLVRNSQHFLLGLFIPSLYLCVADAIAIHEKTWAISEVYTMGIQFGPLPIEEATFFFATNFMLIQGLILFLHPQSQVQAKKIFLRNKQRTV